MDKTKTKKTQNSTSSYRTQTNRSKISQNDDITLIDANDKIIDENTLNKKVKEMMWPWVKTPFAINNFDNRFKAQEKLLQDQQKMMKGIYDLESIFFLTEIKCRLNEITINYFTEQQKIIEDMKFQQSQAAFKEQIALLEQIKNKQLELEKMQKIQYKQEKKLLIQQTNMKRLEKNNKKMVINKVEDLDQVPEEADLNLDLSEDEENSKKETTSKMNSTRKAQISSSRLNNTNLKLDDFNKNMIERAKQRELMKKEREEKRKKHEMERLELLKGND
jgi:hypothetical protein